MRKESTPLAITFSLLASFTYALLAYLIQTAEQILPNSVLVFFRQFFGLLILLPMIPYKLGSYSKLKTTIFPLHLLRTFASLTSRFFRNYPYPPARSDDFKSCISWSDCFSLFWSDCFYNNPPLNKNRAFGKDHFLLYGSFSPELTVMQKP